MFKKFYHYCLNRPLSCLLIYGAILRLLIYIFYNAITLYPDSKGYIDLSTFISNLSLDNYTGERTPGFPLLIAIAGGNLYLTAFFQMIMGLFNIVLIYDFSKMTTKSKAVSFWITFIMASFIHILFFEFAILSETLTLFLVLLSFWFIEKFNVLEPTTSIKYLVILSVILSFLYITKPIFIYVPIGVFIFYFVKNFHFGFRKIILKATTLLIVPLLSFYGWCSLNEKNMGYFASTYYLGVNLSQTATPFFEKAPEEDKLIRDILVKHRELNPMYKSDRKNPMTVWYAWNELKEKTKLSGPDLSNELGRISIDLFKKYPDLYLKQVVVSWTDFWGTSLFFWRTGYIHNKFVEKWAYRLWYSFQQYLLIGINILFLGFAIKKIYHFIQTKFKIFDLDLLLVAIILSGSLAQALVVYGSNSRFCVPFFPLIVYFVMINLFSLKKFNKLNSPKFNTL
ncbi:hypothetical protein [Confluentibacter flavum]|uniref:Glycosyltransferase RgtA/B/C/D-like domain-containing protein n=1 Tax=Confluentibacter flavum TaxID=1909700 RepID=A0A2N3HP75_9FLAO|nr:hypothetical protein [Confluentibacter flavum]PKQ46732.1 hypothetical protein CSW08_01660 [Confluentibacter flavum]